jgi:hypothetical protein
MFTTVESSTTISWAMATTTKTSQRRSTRAAGRSWIADAMGSVPFARSALHGSLPGSGATIAQ